MRIFIHAKTIFHNHEAVIDDTGGTDYADFTQEHRRHARGAIRLAFQQLWRVNAGFIVVRFEDEQHEDSGD